MTRKRINEWPEWPDSRGWVGISVFATSVMLLWMMKDPELRDDEFFQTIATLVIGTGFVGGLVSWAFAATKGGGEAAESSARIAEEAATAALRIQPTGTQGNPLHVAGADAGNAPVTVEEAGE